MQVGRHRTKKLSTAKGKIRVERNPTEWKTVFASYLSVKGFIFKIYKSSKTQ